MAVNKAMQRLAEMPLYEQTPVDEQLNKVLHAYFDGQSFNELSVDLYCLECKAPSTFNPSNENQISHKNNTNSFAFFNHTVNFGIIHYRCSRDRNHYLSVQILLRDDSIIKIGQFPSKADIDSPELNKYAKILPKEKLADLKRATGLASHGIGAGSFVYLRRVFEYLLNESHERAKLDPNFPEEEYQKSRVTERIDLLSSFLPSFMVENRSAYGILSKGVHELSENDCLGAFDLMSGTIELILDQVLIDREKQEKEEKLKKGIGSLHQKLKGSLEGGEA